MSFITVVVCLIGILANTDAQACSPACKAGYKCMINNCVLDVKCPKPLQFGKGPPMPCPQIKDPLNKPKSKLESWFTKEVFNDLFPKANIGWGPNNCFPYNYESFVIAARYFPNFGSETYNNSYNAEQNYKRDLAAFFAHAIQETGENDISLYSDKDTDKASACFYRGGFYNWFEGGPTSAFLPKDKPGHQPTDGDTCLASGLVYCDDKSPINAYYYPCNKDKGKACYFGRGAVQITSNYNYGQFQMWLKRQGVIVDLLKEPNLVMTKTDPPLAIMASLWFYMTAQPPKPAMHDIILGNWEPGQTNRNKNYKGPIFGPTSLIINKECGGEDPKDPGEKGAESRRIKAFKWFCKYFNVPVEESKYLTCKDMPQDLKDIPHNQSYGPDWSSTWKDQTCNCVPATYSGLNFYYQPGFYPDRFVADNEYNRKQCIRMIYDNPSLFGMKRDENKCLNYPPK